MEREALGYEIVRYMSALRRYARNLTKCHTSQVDDLVSETIVLALEKADHFDGRKPREWLFTVMHNLHVTQMRLFKRHGELLLDYHHCMHTGNAPASQDVQMLTREVVRHLVQLPDGMVDVLLKIVGEDRTYDETARVLDIPVGTVRSRLSRSREALRGLLNER